MWISLPAFSLPLVPKDKDFDYHMYFWEKTQRKKTTVCPGSPLPWLYCPVHSATVPVGAVGRNIGNDVGIRTFLHL